MLRVFAVLLVLCAVYRSWIDWQGTISVGNAFRFSSIGEVWFQNYPESLQLIQPAIERHIAEWLWDPVLLTILQWPAALVLVALATVLWIYAWITRKPSGGRRMF
jgi:hypothetical protein